MQKNKKNPSRKPPLSFLNLCATFLGLGYLPMPGTLATLATFPLLWLFSLLDWKFSLPLLGVLALLALLSAHNYDRQCSRSDASEIVIDEVLGFVIALYLLPFHGWNLFIGFCLFRLLDILKPFPISYVDKQIRGGLGIVLDDVLAGLVTHFILRLLNFFVSF